MAQSLSPEDIRALRIDSPKARARDFAQSHGLTEADLVAAHVGHGVVAITAHPDAIMPLVQPIGEVLALTRNESCVHEKVGTYNDYRSGEIAAMVLDKDIDLRIFPAHWVHAFAVVETGESGTKRSIQIFDAAGDAVHKVHLRPASDVAAFEALVHALRLPEQNDRLELKPRRAVEAAKGDPARAGELRARWDKMTDTHQFVPMIRDLGMNRLGANRLAGAPYAEALALDAVTLTLERAAAGGIPIMVFTGNPGCIQIHGGPVHKIAPMGPWINVLDPGFDMHLRTDHIAEVWQVTKPSRTGAAISVEAFDSAGNLLVQIFGYRKDTAAEPWNDLTAALPRLGHEVAA